MQISMPPSQRLRCDFSTQEAIVQGLKWFGLAIVSLGITTAMAGAFMEKERLDKTVVLDAEGRVCGRVVCSAKLGDLIAHGFLWHGIILFTLGLGLFVVRAKTQTWLLDRCHIEPLDLNAPSFG